MRALLNLVGVGIDRSEICCVLFGSVLTSKVTQAFVPQGRTLEENSQLRTGMKPGAT